ncbi:hypothetical protein SLS62_004792 [Diatrype stigma]|uniref:Uncharacterized protein n=1 Tax=Diatrype stigma TaxID=117547 RepID=A0AAN9YP04_9PEZI
MPIVRAELLKRKRGAVVGRRELKEKMRTTPPVVSSSSSSSSHGTTAPFYDNYRVAGISAREIAFLQYATLTKSPGNCEYRKYEQAQKKARKQNAVGEAEVSRDFYDSGDFDAVPEDVAESMDKRLMEDMIDIIWGRVLPSVLVQEEDITTGGKDNKKGLQWSHA